MTVGGGTAGSIVAGRLSEEQGVRVLLLEAGGEQSSKVKVPWFHLWLPNSPHDWKTVTEPNGQALRGFNNQVPYLHKGQHHNGSRTQSWLFPFSKKHSEIHCFSFKLPKTLRIKNKIKDKK